MRNLTYGSNIRLEDVRKLRAGPTSSKCFQAEICLGREVLG